MDPPILNLGTSRRLVLNIRPRPLFPLRRNVVPTEEEAVWFPEPFWTLEEENHPLSLRDFKSRTVQLVA
jgi:hypothetical protein